MIHIGFFSDISLARECETDCGSELFQCLGECGASTECSSSCYRENIVCVDACPCHTGKNIFWHYKSQCVFLRLSIWLQAMQKSYLQTKISSYYAEHAKYRQYSIPANAFWLSRLIKFLSQSFNAFSGKKINFDFEVDKTALVFELSCGAWLNGEYYIITGGTKQTGPILRKVRAI